MTMRYDTPHYSKVEGAMPKISKNTGPSYGVEDALAQQAMDPHAPIEDVRGAREAIVAGRAERGEQGRTVDAVEPREVAASERRRQAEARVNDDSLSEAERQGAQRDLDDLDREDQAKQDEKDGISPEERAARDADERTEKPAFGTVTGHARGSVSRGDVTPSKSTASKATGAKSADKK